MKNHLKINLKVKPRTRLDSDKKVPGWWYVNHNGYNVNTDDENDEWNWDDDDDDDLDSRRKMVLHDEHDKHDHGHDHDEDINLRGHHDLKVVYNAQRPTHDVNL